MKSAESIPIRPIYFHLHRHVEWTAAVHPELFRFDAFHRPTSRTLTYPNGNTETVTSTFDHEGENTLTAAGTQLVEAVGYNDMGQLKRLALGNSLSTWYGYNGYEGSVNNDTYDAKEVTWGWGSGDSFGRLWRICTAPDANTRCQAANKDLSVSGQVLDLRYGYDNVGNVASMWDKINSSQVQTFGYDHLNWFTNAVATGVWLIPRYGEVFLVVCRGHSQQLTQTGQTACATRGAGCG